MTTLREAAQQALEALENPWKSGPDGVAEAITALRAALDAPEHSPDCALLQIPSRDCDCYLALPPEPCGWVYINRATGERTFSRHMAGVVNHTEVVEVPVYAEPPHASAVNQELLEALRWIATVNATDYEYQAKARAAIAKAEGRA